MGEGSQVLELLVAGGIDRSLRLVRVLGKVKRFVLLPADVVDRAESLRAPRSLREIAGISASTVSAPVLREKCITLLYDL